MRIGVCSREKLDGDAPPQMHIFGRVDHAHCALAELFYDSIMRNDLANHGAGLPLSRGGVWCKKV
jgi:hypothetical protein